VLLNVSWFRLPNVIAFSGRAQPGPLQRAVRQRSLHSLRPLTSDPAIVEPALAVVATLVPQLRALSAGIARLDAAIATRCEGLPDFHLFSELPGAGPVVASRLLAAFGEQRERFADAAAVQKCVGVAPVTERSGNKHWVHWRWACPTFLRQTFVEWAASSISHSFWARAFYDSHKAKGSSHNATIRALAFKWIRILSVAGSIELPTTNLATSPPSRNANLRCSRLPPSPLDNPLAVRLRARVGQLTSQLWRHITADRKADTVRLCSRADATKLCQLRMRSSCSFKLRQLIC
jgi:hypothetical protein